MIHLLQEALVILLVSRILGVKRVSGAVFFKGSLPVAFVLQGVANCVVRI